MWDSCHGCTYSRFNTHWSWGRRGDKCSWLSINNLVSWSGCVGRFSPSWDNIWGSRRNINRSNCTWLLWGCSNSFWGGWRIHEWSWLSVCICWSWSINNISLFWNSWNISSSINRWSGDSWGVNIGVRGIDINIRCINSWASNIRSVNVNIRSVDARSWNGSICRSACICTTAANNSSGE